MSNWKSSNKKGIWIDMPTNRVHLLGVLAENGFDFHSARRGSVTMNAFLWDGDSTLPPGPTHQVGVGAVVSRTYEGVTQILVVQEKSGPAARHSFWKVPTGLVDFGEDVPSAAIRELKEETGIDATFDSVLGIRHLYHSNKGDLFFEVRLTIDEFNSSKDLVAQEKEIADVKWMNIEDYMQQPFIQRFESMKCMAQIIYSNLKDKYRGINASFCDVGFIPGKT